MDGETTAVDPVGARAPRHCYRVYGLELGSPVPLPELISGGRGADAAVRFGPVGHTPPEPGRVQVVDGAIYIRYDRVGTVRLAGGAEILVDPAPGLEQAALRLVLTGPVLGLLLHQRGGLVLHGSTVAAGGGAVGFLGFAGSGKSTTAGAFHSLGHSVLSDDLIPVELRGQAVVAQPGFPQLKLWPQAIASLGGDANALPRLHPQVEKRARPVRDRFEPSEMRLERLYVLGVGPEVEIEEIPGAERVIELVRNAYAAQVQPLVAGTRLVEQCAAVAELVPVKRLLRPVEPSSLALVVRRVREDLANSVS